MAIPAMGGILVNRHGQRFVREDMAHRHWPRG
jgi:hypothetical protein